MVTGITEADGETSTGVPDFALVPGSTVTPVVTESDGETSTLVPDVLSVSGGNVLPAVTEFDDESCRALRVAAAARVITATAAANLLPNPPQRRARIGGLSPPASTPAPPRGQVTEPYTSHPASLAGHPAAVMAVACIGRVCPRWRSSGTVNTLEHR